MSKKRRFFFALRLVRWLLPKLEKFAPSLATFLFVRFFFTPLRYGFPKKELEWVRIAKIKRIKVSGKSIAVYSWGKSENPVVFFVHGWAGRATQFRGFFQKFLDAGYQIISFDGPAHGNSEGRRTDVFEFSMVIAEILKTIPKPIAFITHSFGGTVSVYYATQDPSIEKIVNIGVPVIGDMLINTILEAVNGQAKTGENFKKYYHKKYNRSFNELAIETLIKKVKDSVKILVVHDQDDKDVPVSHVEEFVKIYPKAKVYLTSGLGHNRLLTDEGVIAECLDFIRPEGSRLQL